jgi:hypothetical protein
MSWVRRVNGASGEVGLTTRAERGLGMTDYLATRSFRAFMIFYGRFCYFKMETEADFVKS